MGKKLAIKGHPTRGKEVIELLEMMGGKSNCNITGDNLGLCYLIDDESDIVRQSVGYIDYEDGGLNIYTLEEFLMKYPFKVGDKVNSPCRGCVKTVTSMKWDEHLNTVSYKLDNKIYTTIEQLKVVNDLPLVKNENLEETQSNQDIDKDVFRKEFCECCGSQRCSGQDDELEYCERFKNLMDNSGKPMEEIETKRDMDETMFMFRHTLVPNKVNNKLEYKIPDGYEFYVVVDGKIVLEPIKPKYPTTYVECCEVMANSKAYAMNEHYTDVNKLLQTLQTLLICRNVYWKIAGEEMGLGKPWETDLENEELYCIQNYNKQIIKSKTNTAFNKILVFPTEEMRDAFYENFKKEIEECKELL